MLEHDRGICPLSPGDNPCDGNPSPSDVDHLSLDRAMGRVEIALENLERVRRRHFSLKAQMAMECAERDVVIARLVDESRRLFARIGDLREPGKGVAPCTVDAAMEDLDEIEAELQEARSRPT